MIGLRGASRYLHPDFKKAFELECKALSHVRNGMGLKNVQLMVPFCRTVDEGKGVINVLAENGLKQGEDGLKVWVMCELPSNVFAIDEFSKVFDGFSIGSNDLTQLILGCDRDSGDLANVFDESNPAVKTAISQAIQGAHRNGLMVGLCGQAPSDKPEFAAFLVEQGIDSISLTPDSVMKAVGIVAEAESKLNIGSKDKDVMDLAKEIAAETKKIPYFSEKEIKIPSDEDVMDLYEEVSDVLIEERSEEVSRKMEEEEDQEANNVGLFNV